MASAVEVSNAQGKALCDEDKFGKDLKGDQFLFMKVRKRIATF